MKRPTEENSTRVCSMSSAPACAPALATVMASSTSTGVLVMTRTTEVSGANRASK